MIVKCNRNRNRNADGSILSVLLRYGKVLMLNGSGEVVALYGTIVDSPSWLNDDSARRPVWQFLGVVRTIKN